MQEILMKTFKEADSLIQTFFLKKNIRLVTEDFSVKKNYRKRFKYCILDIDFDNFDHLKKAQDFINLNKNINFCALNRNRTKSSVINASNIGCEDIISDINAYTEIINTKILNLKQPEFDYLEEFVGKKILIIDNVESSIKLLQHMLAPFRFEIDCASKAIQSSQMIKKTQYDMIIFDTSMPNIDGYKLAQRIKQSGTNSNTPIIFMSGYGRLEEKIESYNYGSLGYIEKPFDENSVKAQVYGVLKVKKLQNELMQEKEMFITMLTHDLRTPIRAQITALELLIKGNFGNLNEEQKVILGHVIASNQYMRNMAENILLRYKSESTGVRINKKLENIKEIISDNLKKMQYIVSQKNQRIRITYDDTPCFVKFDQIEIKRVISNLIMNASEHSGENSEIRVSVNRFEDRVEVEIADNGDGIKEKESDKIFEKYFTNSKNFKKIGTGLGLYICQRVIAAHDGKIYVKKTDREGTTFAFTLPLKQAQRVDSRILSI